MVSKYAIFLAIVYLACNCNGAPIVKNKRAVIVDRNGFYLGGGSNNNIREMSQLHDLGGPIANPWINAYTQPRRHLPVPPPPPVPVPAPAPAPATPVYNQPQQPAYAPQQQQPQSYAAPQQQPAYAPQQPQPAYAPQQPQPAYAPQQPQFVPQQQQPAYEQPQFAPQQQQPAYEQPQAYPVQQPQAYPVQQPQAYPVQQPQAYPVQQPQAYPVQQPQAYPVQRPQAYPVQQSYEPRPVYEQPKQTYDAPQQQPSYGGAQQTTYGSSFPERPQIGVPQPVVRPMQEFEQTVKPFTAVFVPGARTQFKLGIPQDFNNGAYTPV